MAFATGDATQMYTLEPPETCGRVNRLMLSLSLVSYKLFALFPWLRDVAVFQAHEHDVFLARVYFEYWGQLLSPKKRHHVHIRFTFRCISMSCFSALVPVLYKPGPSWAYSFCSNCFTTWHATALNKTCHTLYERCPFPCRNHPKPFTCLCSLTPENTIDGINWWLVSI